jgi:DNA-binding GntR family transcriptional regulator
MAAPDSEVVRKDGPVGLTQVIYQGLCDEITGGKLKPGERLSRRRIAARYGASYTPVIEAMVRLEHAGLIEAETSQMARVRRISVETIQNDYILREALEAQAIRLACESTTAGEIDDLYRRAEAVDARICLRDRAPREGVGASRSEENSSSGSIDQEGLRIHWQFHRRIAEISRFPVLARELERLELLQRLQANWFFAPGMVNPPRLHSLLVDAIKSRDPESAETTMRVHVRRGMEKELLGYRMKMNL